jgi:hypothetical protein
LEELIFTTLKLQSSILRAHRQRRNLYATISRGNEFFYKKHFKVSVFSFFMQIGIVLFFLSKKYKEKLGQNQHQKLGTSTQKESLLFFLLKPFKSYFHDLKSENLEYSRRVTRA